VRLRRSLFISISILFFVGVAHAEMPDHDVESTDDAAVESDSGYAGMLAKYDDPWDEGKPSVPDFSSDIPLEIKMSCAMKGQPGPLYNGVLFTYKRDEMPKRYQDAYKDSDLFFNLNMSVVPLGEAESPYEKGEWRKKYQGGAIGQLADSAGHAKGVTRPDFIDVFEKEEDRVVYTQNRNRPLGRGISFDNEFTLRMTRDHHLIARRVIKLVDEKKKKILEVRDILCEQQSTGSAVSPEALAEMPKGEAKPESLEDLLGLIRSNSR
jgi:hypothetical protein